MTGIVCAIAGMSATARPGAPTNVSATAGSGSATVSFTAPSFPGIPATITGYRVTSSPGGITATGSSSPITITGLTNGTAYTFTVAATNAIGYGPESSASNSVTPIAPTGQQVYASAGTYSWTAPAGVTSVCVVCVGGGGGGGAGYWAGGGGGGGGLGWKNNISVTPGQSYTVAVGAGGISYTASQQISGQPGGTSYFINPSTVAGYGGNGGSWGVNDGFGPFPGGTGGSYTGDGGGTGGRGGDSNGDTAGGGAGAAGYSGNGGNGGYGSGTAATAGSGGGGGGAPAGGSNSSAGAAGSGGGVGLLGQGASGAASGAGGSGGAQGSPNLTVGGSSNTGGAYGGGGGGQSNDSKNTPGCWGGTGAVRIIWGTGRAFPSTNTQNL